MRTTSRYLLILAAILLAVSLSPAGADQDMPPGPLNRELQRLRMLTSSNYYGQYEREAGQPGPFDEALELMASEDYEDRQKGARYIYHEYQKLADRLIEMVESKGEAKYPEGSRRAAAGMLGLLRMEKGIIALSNGLESGAFANAYGGMDMFEPMRPASNSLVYIGRPAVPQLVENLRTSDDHQMIYRSWICLSHILGGPERTLELIEKLITLEPDPAAKERLLKVQNDIKNRGDWPDEPPLY